MSTVQSSLWFLAVILVSSHGLFETVTGVQIDRSASHSILSSKPGGTTGDPGIKTDSKLWTPEVSVHLLSLVEAIHTKLATWEVRIGQLEAQMSTLQSQTSDGEHRIESKMEAIADQISSKIKDGESQLAAVEQRLEAQILRISGDVSRELKSEVSDFGNKLTNAVVNLGDRLQQEINLLKEIIKVKSCGRCISDVSMLGVGNELQKFGQFVVDGIAERLDKITNGIESDNKKLLNHFRNFTDSVEEITSSSVKQQEEFLERFDEKLDPFLLNVVEKLEKKLDNQHEILNTTLTTFENIQLYFDEECLNITPQAREVGPRRDTFSSCKKGMQERTAERPYPYPIVYSNRGSHNELQFLCDTTTAGGGWIIIQYRARGDTDFYRGWEDYKNGFGSLQKDFWLGLETIYTLTSSANYELRIEMKYKGESKYAHYSKFRVANESHSYRLDVGDYDGTAGDELKGTYNLNRMMFSTKDRDNDLSRNSCAVMYHGAWWYNNCHNSNLNGKWGEGGGVGPKWHSFTGNNPATFTEMKIRRVDN